MAAFDSETIEAMLRAVDPDWELSSATPAERGFCRVYRVTVGRTEGPPGDAQTLYLKATPGENDGGIPADARILAVLDDRTEIPVPEVLGVVDEHPSMPAPFYVMTPIPGSELPYEQVGFVPDDVLRTVARQVGATLGDLHGVEAPDSFGHVTHDDNRPLVGARPSGTVAGLDGGGYDSWEAFLWAWVDRELGRHEQSRFDALTPRLRAWCDERLAVFEERGGEQSPAPVLGRNDHGFHNLLVEESTGEVTGMLDWAYTLAVTPAFDFEYAAYLYSGAFLAGLPDVRDRRELVRTAMLAGYRGRAPGRVDAVAGPTPLYELLAAVRVMNDFESLTPRGQHRGGGRQARGGCPGARRCGVSVVVRSR